MPVEVFFREESDFTAIENRALSLCGGRVLDVGAGAGALSIALQERGLSVTALENDSDCIEVMKGLGIHQCLEDDLWKHDLTYDTVLVMMNGLGLAGTLSKVPEFLTRCSALLKPGGQILIDSSDISYMYKEGVDKPDHYYGEVRYRYEYDDETGSWFDWVYVDQDTIKPIVAKLGLSLEIMMTDPLDQYLMRITRPTH